MMNQLTFGRGQEVIPAAGGAEWQRQERTHLENLWQDTVEPFKVIGDAWKNDRGQFTQETLRAINLAFNPVLKDEKGKYCFNSRALVYWGGLAVIGLGVLSACKMINNPDGGGITPGPKTPTPESLCPDLIRIAAVNSVDVAVAAAAWQAADQAQLRQDLACFVPESTSLTVGEILTVGQNAGSEIVQLAWARGGEVTPLLAVPGGQIDDLQLVNFLDPHTSQWEVLTPDQAQTQLAAVNINSASGEIEPEASGVTITATRDFNNNISFQINNPDGTQVTLSQDQVKNNLALVPWLTQVENLLKGQEMLSFEVVSGVDLSVATAEKFNLPQEVFALAREKHLAPIETEGSKFAASCTTDSCTVMLTDVLVTGAELQPATDGKVIYGFDGQAGSEALFRFTNLPEGVRATAFVSQEGNPWGFKPGTVVVWFWQGGGKGPARILNPDPAQIMADKPNSISLTAIDNGLVITRTGPDGAVIDKQTVAFLPPLPSEFLSQIPKDSYSYDANGLHITVAEGQVIDIPQDQIAEKFQGEVFILDLNQQSESGYQLGMVWRDNQWRETLINFPFETNGENIDNLPEIALEDITSGRLAEAERLAAQPFPENALPFLTYYYDEKYLTISPYKAIGGPGFDRERYQENLQHPETKPLRVPFFYQAEINNVQLVMATVQALNQDWSVRFIHMFKGRAFINSRWDYWIKFITLKYMPLFNLALYDDCIGDNDNPAAAQVVCPINAPRKAYLEGLIGQWVDQAVIPEEMEKETFYLLGNASWNK